MFVQAIQQSSKAARSDSNVRWAGCFGPPWWTTDGSHKVVLVVDQFLEALFHNMVGGVMVRDFQKAELRSNCILGYFQTAVLYISPGFPL
jgi:hypothetical protein